MKIFKKVRGGGGGDKKPTTTDKNSLKSPRGGTEGACDLDNIWGEVESMVGEPLHALPVHKDLHRLAPTTHVWDSDGRLINGPDLFAEDEKDDRKKRFLPTKRVLWALASTVDAAKRDSIMNTFEEKVAQGSLNDIVGSMQDFFASIDDGDAVVPRLRTLRILKLVNQSILAPAVIHLNLFLTKSPEKDTYMNAGAWKIHINFHKDGGVTVRHTKWEKTKDSSFKWHLKMNLNESFSMMEEAAFSFLKVRFPPTEEGQARRQAFLQYIGKFYSGQAQIADKEREMWQRPHHSLPIHKSLPAIAYRTTLISGDTTLYAPTSGASSEHNIKTLLMALARSFSPAKENVISTEFDKHFQKNDPVASLKYFLREILKLSDDESDECKGLTAVLKTLHSSVVAPCLSLLHERLIALADPASPFAALPAIREKGDWLVTIRVHSAKTDSDQHAAIEFKGDSSGEPNDEQHKGKEKGDDSDQEAEIKSSASSSSSSSLSSVSDFKSSNKRWVTVRHTKWAASEVQPTASNYVEFGWHVEMDLDRALHNMTGVRIQLEDIHFGTNVDSDHHREMAVILRQALE